MDTYWHIYWALFAVTAWWRISAAMEKCATAFVEYVELKKKGG